jgi:hypothetical protein
MMAWLLLIRCFRLGLGPHHLPNLSVDWRADVPPVKTPHTTKNPAAGSTIFLATLADSLLNGGISRRHLDRLAPVTRAIG